ASLSVFTLALVLWYWTLQRYAGERVAMYFALLFCCSPPLLTAYSVATLGGHAESILFSALTVFLLFRLLAEEEGSWASRDSLCRARGPGRHRVGALRTRASVGGLGPSPETRPV